MSNLFDETARKIKDSPFVMWVFLLTLAMLVIGGIGFAEDAISSRNGIETLEKVFGVKPTNLWFAYYTVSLIPQVGQTVLMYMFFFDRKKNWWALWAAMFLFTIDFVFDLQDRSNNHFIPLQRTVLADGTLGPAINLDGTTLVAAGFTITAYTLGSELFLSVAFGMLPVLLPFAIREFATMYVGVSKEWASARSMINKARADNAPQRPHQQQKTQNMYGGGGKPSPGYSPHQHGGGGGGQQQRQGQGNGHEQPRRQQQQPSPQRPPVNRNVPATEAELAQLFEVLGDGGGYDR